MYYMIELYFVITLKSVLSLMYAWVDELLTACVSKQCGFQAKTTFNRTSTKSTYTLRRDG